jgi:hypothetical protein
MLYQFPIQSYRRLATITASRIAALKQQLIALPAVFSMNGRT